MAERMKNAIGSRPQTFLDGKQRFLDTEQRRCIEHGAQAVIVVAFGRRRGQAGRPYPARA